MHLIISFDGGGFRGYLSAGLLDRLITKVPDLLGHTKLFAGTSTGAIIACCLGIGKVPETITNFYSEHGKNIFKDSLFDNLRDGGRMFGAQYGNKVLIRELTNIFGDSRIQDLETDILAPSYNMNREKPRFFDYDHPNVKLVDVCMASSAAPTFFPIFQQKKQVNVDGMNWVDGGIVANNPSLCAVAQFISDDHKYKKGLEDIILLSVGAGASKNGQVKIKDPDWGITKWFFSGSKKLIPTMFEASVETVNYQVKHLLGKRFFRLDISIPNDVEVFKISKISKLEAILNNEDTKLALDECASWWNEVKENSA